MRGSPGRRCLRALVTTASTGAVLGAGAAALALALPASFLPAAFSSAPADVPGPESRVLMTVPGSPGLPQPPTTVYAEDFENGTGQTPILLSAYTGAPPVNAKYTAAAQWIDAPHCNGIILNQSGANQPACQNQNTVAMAELKFMANVLGQVTGAANPSQNHAVSAYTDGANPGANRVEFQTVNPVPLAATNRFITFSVDVAAVNCQVSGPQLNFFLTGGGPDVPATSAPINPCGDPRSTTYNTGPRPIQAGSFPGDSSVLFSGAAVGIKMTNANGSGLGNDHAYDNIRILDVTPQLDKEFSPAAIEAGDVSTVTFTVTNTTELAAKSGFGFTDNLPTGVSVAATPNASTTCGAGTVAATAGGTTIGLTGGSLAAGTASCTVTVDVTSATVGTYVNEPSGLEPTGVNPPGPATLTVTVPGAPTITKAAGQTSFVPGQTITYTYTVTNNADQALSNVTVTDDGPGSPVVTCPAGPLAPGASVNCTASYQATQTDANTGTVTNSATVTGTLPNGEALTGASNQVVVPLRALTVTKAVEESQFSGAGETLHYTFTVTNTGRVPLEDLTVTDVGPGNPTVTCPVTALEPGATTGCTATYTTTAADVQAGEVADSATAAAETSDGDPVSDDSNTVTVPYAAPPETDLAVVKTGPATVEAGAEITYTLTITNNGPDDSTGWKLTDNVPAGLTNVTTSTPGCGIGAGVLTCTGGALADGASTVIELRGTAVEGTESVTNTATVTGNEDDPNPGNNTSTVTTDITAEVDLAVTKTGPATAEAGDTVTYEITVTNNGPGDSTGWTLTDTIPAGLSGATTGTPGCGIGAGVLTCTGGPLDEGDSTVVRISGTVAAGTTSITNRATVTGNEDDPDPGNNTGTATTAIASVEIVKKQNGPAAVRPGDTVTYTVTVTNRGGAAVAASFTDNLSELLDDADYNSASTTTGTVSYTEPVLTWQGTLDPGETATITFSVTVRERTFGDLRLDNTVVSPTPGSNCPAGGTDPRCTTHGTVKPQDKGKDGHHAPRTATEGRDRPAPAGQSRTGKAA
jgi:uncharacterized repeat protein (TIGR01451 family)